MEFCLIEAIHVLFFIIPYIFDKGKRFPYKKNKTGTLCVLANGPSLKEVLKKIDNKEFYNVEFSVMNSFADVPEFEIIKPKYYCMVDPLFIHETVKIDLAMKAFKALNEKVNWEMTLFIPSFFGLNRFLAFSHINNPFINIRVLPSIRYGGESTFIPTILFKYGMTIPRMTVAQTCIYIGINSGFEEIHLYGMEHTFINTLAVDKQSRLCWKDEHFYDDKMEQKLFYKNDGSLYKISEYLLEKSILFKTHDILALYAKQIGCKILNYTPITMIDSYKRYIL